MSERSRFLVDADVFISAKNRYYAFDICPGFWDSLIFYHRQGLVLSVDRVRGELLAGRRTEDLVVWVRNELPKGFFLEVDSEPVTTAYADIMLWSQRHPKYFDLAKAKFATGADGWLVAYARTHGMTVVTNEQSAPDSKREIKLPDVCDQFDVKYLDTFSMLRRLGTRLKWTADP